MSALSSYLLSCPGTVDLWILGESSGTTADDAAPASHDGTYGNTPTLGATGLCAGDAATATTFASASSEDVSVAYHADLDLGISDLWVHLLFKTTTNAVQFLFNKGSAEAMEIWTDGDNIYSRDDSIPIVTAAHSVTPFRDGVAHQLILYRDRDGITGGRFYMDGAINGSPVNISSTAGYSYATAQALNVGSRFASGDGFNGFNGTLQYVAWGKGVLTAQNIADLYTIFSTGGGTATAPLPAALAPRTVTRVPGQRASLR